VNPDTGRPVIAGEDQLRRADFRKIKHAETVAAEALNSRRTFFSPLWQADRERIQRMAPIEFIGRYLSGFFDYGIADEVRELKGETAQGNALGTIASACERTVILTGTLLGGYADELFNILYRLEARMTTRSSADDCRKSQRTAFVFAGISERAAGCGLPADRTNRAGGIRRGDRGPDRAGRLLLFDAVGAAVDPWQRSQLLGGADDCARQGVLSSGADFAGNGHN
jgi:hypothetical protein